MELRSLRVGCAPQSGSELVGDRRRTALVDIKELTPPVRPAEGERHRAAAMCIEPAASFFSFVRFDTFECV
jgi:hypothetical protein